MKRYLWVLPVLAIGMAIGGLTLPHVLAATGGQSSSPASQVSTPMQQALNTPEGQAMINQCGSFMSQFYQNQK